MADTPRATVESGPTAPNGNAVHKLTFAGKVIITRTGLDAVRAQLDELAEGINGPIEARVTELLEANNREVERRRQAEAERDEWNRDARRLSGGLCAIHGAPANATVGALKSVAYDIALNCIEPETARFQIEKRSGDA